MKGHYFNEFDPFAAAWLRELIRAGHLPPGEVDERSITEVAPDDLRGFVSCHFFAGVGVWAHALRLAGWPDDRPVWTGSCPCQPFSAAGKRGGEADARHLWPELFRLIRECRPDVCFGEQVASKDGLRWLDGVCADLEGAGYAVGALDTCAAGAGEEAEGWVRRGDSVSVERIIVGAPHIRQRLYWVAHAERPGVRVSGRGADGAEAAGVQGADGQRQRLRADAGTGGGPALRVADPADIRRGEREHGRGVDGSPGGAPAGVGVAVPDGPGRVCPVGGLADHGGERRERRADAGGSAGEGAGERCEGVPDAESGGVARGVEHPASDGREQGGGERERDDAVPLRERQGESCGAGGRAGGLGDARGDGPQGVRRPGSAAGPVVGAGGAGAGFWSAFELVACRDGKARRVEPGTFPLAHGSPARVGRLRGYGNALVAGQASQFVAAFLEVEAEAEGRREAA